MTDLLRYHDLIHALEEFADLGNWVSAQGPMGDTISGFCGQQDPQPWNVAAKALEVWADVSSRLQQLERLLAALDETDVEDAIAQIEFDVKRSVDVANEIKQLESWPPNSWPSMNDRTIYSALLHRAKDAEERLQQLEQEKATLETEVVMAERANKQFADVLRLEYEARQKAEAALAETRDALQQLVEKLDVILPVVDGYIAMTHIRSGGQYKGPNIIEELKHAKELLARVKEQEP